jgi:hypothetical protein
MINKYKFNKLVLGSASWGVMTLIKDNICSVAALPFYIVLEQK